MKNQGKPLFYSCRSLFSSHSPEGSDGSSSDQYIELKFYHSMAQPSSDKWIHLYNTASYTWSRVHFFFAQTENISDDTPHLCTLFFNIQIFHTIFCQHKMLHWFCKCYQPWWIISSKLSFFSLVQMKCELAPTGSFSIQSSWSLERKMQLITMPVATTLLAKTKLTWH